MSSSLLDALVGEKLSKSKEYRGSCSIDDLCFVCGRKSLFSRKSPNYERNATLITRNSTDFMNFLGIVFEQAVEKGIKIHNQCKFEARFKAQFSRDASFRERCSFVREACWSASQPTIVHAVDIILTEPASNIQFLQPENI